MANGAVDAVDTSDNKKNRWADYHDKLAKLMEQRTEQHAGGGLTPYNQVAIFDFAGKDGTTTAGSYA